MITYNSCKDISGILNEPTPISEQLNMIKILSVLVFCFFFDSLYSNTAFEVTIANAVNIVYICRIKRSTEWLCKIKQGSGHISWAVVVLNFV